MRTFRISLGQIVAFPYMWVSQIENDPLLDVVLLDCEQDRS